VGKTKVLLVESITDILSHEFLDCGYRLMTSYLQRDGYRINHKKLYRIYEREKAYWTRKPDKQSGSGRKVCDSQESNTLEPFDCLEMDIKMVWLPVPAKRPILLSYYRCPNA